MGRYVSGTKGQGGWAEVLMTILMIGAIAVLAFQIPKIVGDFAGLLTLASAESTARGLAGMITVSGAAPDSITIIYEGEGEEGDEGRVYYDLKIEDRLVHITGVSTETGGGFGRGGSDAGDGDGWAKIAVGRLDETFRNVRVFTIEKDRIVVGDATIDHYDVSAS